MALSSPKILLFPFLAHGHISTFLELARNLSNHNFLVYFCSTPVNLKSFAKKIADYGIKPVEFHLQSPPELPPHYHTTNGLPPHLIFSLLDALGNSGHVFTNILTSLQPELVIYDISQTWLPPLAASYNIPSVYFQTTGAATYSHFLRLMMRPDLEFPSSAIFYRESEINSFRRVKSQSKDTDKEKEKEKEQKKFVSCIEQSNEIILIRSSKALEEKYIDFQSIVVDKKMVSLGTLVSEPEDDLDDDSEIIQWLNGKKEASTVYVSFGSEIFLTKEELKEVALGLEISHVNFIWVIRSPDGEKTSLEELMPEGFLERIKGKGFIEEVWAPQSRILKHPSIGGFVSHCGWGSLVESITFGVPIIAMPMQYDQPLNARLVVELGVGLEVVGGENGERKGEEIARIIEEVVIKDEGKAIFRKSRELAEKVRVKSREEVHVAVQELRSTCEKSKSQKQIHATSPP